MKSRPYRSRAQPMRVAVCIDTRDGPGRERLHGVYRFAVGRRWNLLLVQADDLSGVRQLEQMHVDGAILCNRLDSFHRHLRRRGIICVEAGSRNLAHDDAAVYVDDDSVGHQAFAHLTSAEFSNFAYCGPPNTNTSSARRAASFKRQAETRGFSADEFSGEWVGSDPLFESLTRWLVKLPKPCGILTFDDKIAERVIAACKCAEIAIPDEVGVLGVGDDELICELLEPQLSSLRVPLRQVGYRAAELLEALARGRNVTRRHMVRPLDVAIRASTDRLAQCLPTVRTAIALIRSRAHEPIGTDQIAELVKVPRRTLERRFVDELGKTVHDVVVEYRVRMAKHLLGRTQEPIGEIARRCGYAAQTAFIRMFQKEVDHAPASYRTLVRDREPLLRYSRQRL